MKITMATLFVTLLVAVNGLSQNDPYIINQQGSVTFLPMYQRWSLKDNYDFSEFSSAVSLYVPFGKEWSMSLRGSPTSVAGDVEHMSSFADAQLGAAYHVENPDIVFTLGLNLPTGKRELTRDEFETGILLSNSVFNLQAPNLGQGLNVSPGLIWAIPLNEGAVIGLGASYQYRGKYKPLAAYDDYDPGDELVLTGGVDLRLDETSTLSGDMIFTTYGTDKLGGDEIFSPGSKIVGNIQFNKAFGADQLWLSAQYREKSKNRIAAGSLTADEVDKAEPDWFELRASYAVRISDRLSAAVIAAGKFYQDTQIGFAGHNLFGVGLEPDVAVSGSVTVPLRLKYQVGELKDGTHLSGVNLGAGLILKF